MIGLTVCVGPGAEQAQEVYRHIREQTQKHLDTYAREGLRTLCVAKKVTPELPAEEASQLVDLSPKV